MVLIGEQMQFLALEVELLAEFRVHGHSPLGVHFSLGAEVLRVEQQVLQGFRVLSRILLEEILRSRARPRMLYI